MLWREVLVWTGEKDYNGSEFFLENGKNSVIKNIRIRVDEATKKGSIKK